MLFNVCCWVCFVLFFGVVFLGGLLGGGGVVGFLVFFPKSL